MDVTLSFDHDRELTTREKFLINAMNIEETRYKLAKYKDLTDELKRLEDEEMDLLKKLLAERASEV